MMRKSNYTDPFKLLKPDSDLDDLEESKDLEVKKKKPGQNNVLNVAKFEDCDFENCTIILNFEAPD
jgi:hypothetical protein